MGWTEIVVALVVAMPGVISLLTRTKAVTRRAEAVASETTVRQYNALYDEQRKQIAECREDCSRLRTELHESEERENYLEVRVNLLEDQMRQERQERTAGRRRFHSIADAVAEGIVVIDGNGLVTFWSAGAARMFGWSAHEMIGQNLLAIIPERYRAPHTAALTRLRRGQRMHLAGHILALEGLHRDGSEIAVDLTLTPWSDVEHEPQDGQWSYIGVLRYRRESQQILDTDATAPT